MTTRHEPQGRVCIFTQNCPEILITHFGAFYNRAIPVPIYATSSRDEVAYIVNDSGATILFTGDQRQYDIARQVIGDCPTLKFIVTLHPSVKRDKDDKSTLTWQEFLATGDKLGNDVLDAIGQRKQQGVDSDIMYLIYTSGTTGVPKGVMLMHSNMNAAMDAHIERFDGIIDDKTDVSLSFLPFSHVFELGWTMVCLCTGIRVAINYDPREIQRAVKEVQPNYMCSVPRFWEKVYTAINDNLQGAKPVVRMMVKQAIRVGKARNLKYARLGKKAPALIESQYQYFEKKVFQKLRGAIGVTDGKMFPTAGAMLSDNITEFLHAVGINICIGYGLSETDRRPKRDPGQGTHRDEGILQQARRDCQGHRRRRMVPHRRLRRARPHGRNHPHRAPQGPVQDQQRQVHRTPGARDHARTGQIHRAGGHHRRRTQIRLGPHRARL